MGSDIVGEIIERVPMDFHMSGSLAPDVLRRIVELHSACGARTSLETGCGLTTLIFSNLSERHTSFTIPSGDSLQKTEQHEYFQRRTTNFVIGPTQITLPKWQFSDTLDFALLDGPHAYPFPDLEYYYVYPNVRRGGILAIDDIHIPTIGRLYEFLRDDEMWEHCGDVRTTAFFRRTGAPVFDPYGDNWPAQRYNRRHFTYPEALAGLFGPGWREAEFGEDQPEQRSSRAASAAADLAHAQGQLAQARSELESLRSSTSWRLTGPLRAAKPFLAARFRR